MRKKFIAVIVACLMLAMSVPVLGAAQNPTQTPEERMQEEISELRELVQMLVLLLQNQQPTQNNTNAPSDVPQISMQRARDIALEHVTGEGTIGAIMLFREDGVLTYEVNIATSAANYTIYIDALTWAITGNNREVVAVWQPPAPVQTPQPSPRAQTPSSTHTPGSSSSSSSSPSGR